MGHRMPEGTQCTQRQAISGGGANLFCGAATMSRGPRGAADIAESRKEGAAKSGSQMRYVWRKHGQGDLARWGLNVPPRRNKPPARQDLQAVRHNQRPGS